MPDLSDIRTIVVVGAVYVDLDYEVPKVALKNDIDTQLFCDAKLTIGGTGFNQAKLFDETASPTQNVFLITILGEDPVSMITREMVESGSHSFDISVIGSEKTAASPIITILREKFRSESRRLMIGPTSRYISFVWHHIGALCNVTKIKKNESALIFDGYSLTDYQIDYETRLKKFTNTFQSSTLLLLPHKIYQSIGKETLFSALNCFDNLESSFYTVSRVISGAGDTAVPEDSLVKSTVRELNSVCPRLEMNLRYGAMDAQYCANYSGGDFITITEYDLSRLGVRSVGDQVQIREMIRKSEINVKHRREISVL